MVPFGKFVRVVKCGRDGRCVLGYRCTRVVVSGEYKKTMLTLKSTWMLAVLPHAGHRVLCLSVIITCLASYGVLKASIAHDVSWCAVRSMISLNMGSPQRTKESLTSSGEKMLGMLPTQTLHRSSVSRIL